MNNSFTFSRLPQVLFGPGKISDLPGYMARKGRSALLVTGNTSFSKSGGLESLVNEVNKRGIKISIETISGEPSPEVIDYIVAKYIDTNPDMVVAAGGGSVVDAGKAVAAMLTTGGPVYDYLEGVGTRDHPGSRLPFFAVPTTSGTGSEATKNAVLSRTGRDGFKRSLRHENFIPDLAVVDPLLTVSCPPAITAASGMDCFTQLTEAFLSPVSSPFTDALALEGIRAVRSGLLKAYYDGTDTGARSDMSMAALMSGICLANAGLGVIHGFASSIGGLYNIPHGNICGILMAPSNKITLRELRRRGGNGKALHKYSALGKIFSDDLNRTDEYYADSFISYLYSMAEDLKLPRLSGLGISNDDIGKIAGLTECKNNPVKLTSDELEEILLLSL